MKVSVNYWMVGGFEGELPIADAAQTAKSIGYDAIELCYGAGELLPSTDEGKLAALRSRIAEAGLEIASLATGAYWRTSLSSPDDTERTAAVEFTEAYIKAAGALGVDAVLVVPGSVDVGWDPSRPVVPAKQAYALSQRSIRTLLPVAEAAGVCVAVENVWNKFLTGPFEFASYIDSFASPFVKAYFDVGNCLINGYPEHWIELLGDRIARLHFRNFTRKNCGGTLDDFAASLLDGDVDWRRVFEALNAIGYDGYVTAEVIVGDAGMPNIEQAERVCGEMKRLIEQYG
ncbi:MAG TPA: sugar phosphate isomerase/epimerase [Candidatus Hydrogenedentes bacterium]|nr:sugar phosphate isomerase/epimerase [Candidatus Hydrogenedentota bacterium]HIJ74830.1 sugar phosphate isomerase/epimerase [Candidatus Hydrogenedentota bacterium]